MSSPVYSEWDEKNKALWSRYEWAAQENGAQLELLRQISLSQLRENWRAPTD